MEADYVIVGSGLTGAVIARILADAGKSVAILERRSHLGGNVHDSVHASGISIHAYGPHYFRTNNDDLWAFVNRFSAFYPFSAVVKSWIDGKFENWPIAESSIRRIAGTNWKPDFQGVPSNFEEASLAIMPRAIYEKFVKGYTEKQWGVAAATLAAGLARRFDVRADDEPRLVRHKWQGLPVRGYSGMMQRMLAGIPIHLNCDYLSHRASWQPRRLTVFTGPIDEYFGFDLGRLKYRGQQRQHEYFPDAGLLQPCGQVNNPDPTNGPHIRTLEWKHMMANPQAPGLRGTVLTRETPFSPSNPSDYEYPFPDAANAQLYRSYNERAVRVPRLLVCGRLGEYRYYDMDQAMARAMLLAGKILEGRTN